jgi:hypothetical protein
MKRVVVLLIGLLLAAPAGQVAASQEISQENLAPFGVAIRIHEYNCPCASLGYYKGPCPRGEKFKIYCGPTEEKVYRQLCYEVILSPSLEKVMQDPQNSRVYVSPWRD